MSYCTFQSLPENLEIFQCLDRLQLVLKNETSEQLQELAGRFNFVLRNFKYHAVYTRNEFKLKKICIIESLDLSKMRIKMWALI